MSTHYENAEWWRWMQPACCDPCKDQHTAPTVTPTPFINVSSLRNCNPLLNFDRRCRKFWMLAWTNASMECWSKDFCKRYATSIRNATFRTSNRYRVQLPIISHLLPIKRCTLYWNYEIIAIARTTRMRSRRVFCSPSALKSSFHICGALMSRRTNASWTTCGSNTLNSAQ